MQSSNKARIANKHFEILHRWGTDNLPNTMLWLISYRIISSHYQNFLNNIQRPARNPSINWLPRPITATRDCGPLAERVRMQTHEPQIQLFLQSRYRILNHALAIAYLKSLSSWPSCGIFRPFLITWELAKDWWEVCLPSFQMDLGGNVTCLRKQATCVAFDWMLSTLELVVSWWWSSTHVTFFTLCHFFV